MVADARRIRVGDHVEAGSVMDYLYDFGDSWEHLLTVRSVTDAVPQTRYPRLVDGAMACPPEDVGGFPGYETFVDALANPRHPERRDMVEWWGTASFDLSAFDREAVDTSPGCGGRLSHREIPRDRIRERNHSSSLHIPGSSVSYRNARVS